MSNLSASNITQLLQNVHDIYYDKNKHEFWWRAEYFGGGYERWQNLNPSKEFKETTGTTHREWFPVLDSGFKKITKDEMYNMLNYTLFTPEMGR